MIQEWKSLKFQSSKGDQPVPLRAIRKAALGFAGAHRSSEFKDLFSRSKKKI